MSEEFNSWLDAHEDADWHWYVKRLSANDTLATKSHQAGPYLPNESAFLLFPSLQSSGEPNPKVSIVGQVDSHSESERELSLTWYRSAKNECRITRWGGRSSAVLDPESTGSVAIFAFLKTGKNDAEFASVWICTVTEEDVLTERIGPVEPGRPLLLSKTLRSQLIEAKAGSCWLTQESAPAPWLIKFPTGEELINRCIELRPCPDISADDRLMTRRECEFTMFKSIESLHVLPRLRVGFTEVDDFIAYSNSVNNRRKSRSGRSLELHVRGILREENIPFSHGEVSEENKRPDFLFPSAEAYRRQQSPLWMLAAKTTCKDRWRQILNEADLIPKKHLITLQEGVSLNQFNEMKGAGVSLVVPRKLHKSYPEDVRDELLTFESFLASVRAGTS